MAGLGLGNTFALANDNDHFAQYDAAGDAANAINSYEPIQLITKLKLSTNFEEENFILNSAIRVAANDTFRNEITRAQYALNSVLDYAENRAKYAAFAVEGIAPAQGPPAQGQGLGLLPARDNDFALPRSYKKALVIKAYFDAFQEGLLIWNFSHPYIVPILENGNFMTQNPTFRQGSLPNPLQLRIPNV